MVEKWNSALDGELSETNMRLKLEARGYRVQQYVYPAGTCFPEHSHAVDKIDAVLSGHFKMTLQGQSIILEAGDCVEVPKGVKHSAEVIGTQAVISLDAVKE